MNQKGCTPSKRKRNEFWRYKPLQNPAWQIEQHQNSRCKSRRIIKMLPSHFFDLREMLEVPFNFMICWISYGFYHKPTIRPILSIFKPVRGLLCTVTLYCQSVVYFRETKWAGIKNRNDTKSNWSHAVIAGLQVKDTKMKRVKEVADKNCDTGASRSCITSFFLQLIA